MTNSCATSALPQPLGVLQAAINFIKPAFSRSSQNDSRSNDEKRPADRPESINDRRSNKRRLSHNKPNLSPEFIAKQRANREARKKAERAARAKETNPEHVQKVPDTSFIKRPLLAVPDAIAFSNGQAFKIMTYNVLAQSLIRRDLFPGSGDAIKWKWRAAVLDSEIHHYHPDVLGMQEVDADKFNSYWKPLLNDMGHSAHFTTTGGKSHGQIISYSRNKFRALQCPVMITFDEIDTPDCPRLFDGGNTAMFLVLQFKDDSHSGIIIGTTHMLWIPAASYERTRQLALYMVKAGELQQKYPTYPVFLTGDFNTECFDTPYLAATRGPAGVDAATKKDLEEVVIERLDWLEKNFKFSGTLDTTNDQAAHSESESAEQSAQRQEQLKLQASSYIDNLISMYDKIPHRAISLYGSNYNKVHPTNKHQRNSGEPEFSNWAYAWRGLIDYILILENKDVEPNPDEVTPGVKVLELLRLPESKEMGELPSGQPRIGQYPSDHLCLMAAVSVKTDGK